MAIAQPTVAAAFVMTDANALRRGRVSIPNADYFVPICTSPQQPVLVSNLAADIVAEAHRLTADGSWRLRCGTVMPDHVHLFFTLGSRLTLSQCVARQKKIRARWQNNFYDHRLRSNDSAEATIRYVWMNPYR